jgi:hypothetical protein
MQRARLLGCHPAARHAAPGPRGAAPGVGGPVAWKGGKGGKGGRAHTRGARARARAWGPPALTRPPAGWPRTPTRPAVLQIHGFKAQGFGGEELKRAFAALSGQLVGGTIKVRPTALHPHCHPAPHTRTLPRPRANLSTPCPRPSQFNAHPTPPTPAPSKTNLLQPGAHGDGRLSDAIPPPTAPAHPTPAGPLPGPSNASSCSTLIPTSRPTSSPTPSRPSGEGAPLPPHHAPPQTLFKSRPLPLQPMCVSTKLLLAGRPVLRRHHALHGGAELAIGLVGCAPGAGATPRPPRARAHVCGQGGWEGVWVVVVGGGRRGGGRVVGLLVWVGGSGWVGVVGMGASVARGCGSEMVSEICAPPPHTRPHPPTFHTDVCVQLPDAPTAGQPAQHVLCTGKGNRRGATPRRPRGRPVLLLCLWGGGRRGSAPPGHAAWRPLGRSPRRRAGCGATGARPARPGGTAVLRRAVRARAGAAGARHARAGGLARARAVPAGGTAVGGCGWRRLAGGSWPGEGWGAAKFMPSGCRTNLPLARRWPDIPGALFRRSRKEIKFEKERKNPNWGGGR